jgi:ribosomal-protein-alanine N-acetyltransferase
VLAIKSQPDDNRKVTAMILTPARKHDAAHLAAMSRRLIEAGLEPCWTKDRIERSLKHEDSVVLTARIHGQIGGFGIMQYGDNAAHLNLLAVEPMHRRHGIGLKLVRWLEDTARGAGTFIIELEVRAINAGARAFYQALGYEETRLMQGYYQNVEDAIRLTRDLKSR